MKTLLATTLLFLAPVVHAETRTVSRTQFGHVHKTYYDDNGQIVKSVNRTPSGVISVHSENVTIKSYVAATWQPTSGGGKPLLRTTVDRRNGTVRSQVAGGPDESE